MDKLSTLLACLPPSDFKNIFTQEITQLRAKVAELEAKLAKYENIEPIAWADGGDLRGVAQGNSGWMHPEDQGRMIPLYALEK